MLSDVPSAARFLVDVFSFVFHAEFEVRVLPLEEFRWKTFLGEDLEPLVVLVVSFAWEIVRDSPMINFVSQTMNKCMLPGNAKCSMTSLADTKHIFRERFIYDASNFAAG